MDDSEKILKKLSEVADNFNKRLDTYEEKLSDVEDNLNKRLDVHEKKTGEIYTSLVGNDLGHKGLVTRVKESEDYILGDKKQKWYLMGGLSVISAGLTHFVTNLFKP